MQEEIDNLKVRIEELEKWKAQRIEHQLSLPFDVESVNILKKYFLSIIASYDFVSVSGKTFSNIVVKQDLEGGVINVGFPLYVFTTDYTTDTITVGADVVRGRQGSFALNQQVFVMSTNTLPSPLSDIIPYYVINPNASGTQFQLSTTLGGAVVNLVDNGTGRHFIQFFNN